jgi:hypothetical protein
MVVVAAQRLESPGTRLRAGDQLLLILDGVELTRIPGVMPDAARPHAPTIG